MLNPKHTLATETSVPVSTVCTNCDVMYIVSFVHCVRVFLRQPSGLSRCGGGAVQQGFHGAVRPAVLQWSPEAFGTHRQMSP